MELGFIVLQSWKLVTSVHVQCVTILTVAIHTRPNLSRFNLIIYHLTHISLFDTRAGNFQG